MNINPEFKSLIPPLSADEFSQLEANILAEGCRDSLVVWNGTLIDGHNRYEICSKHGLPYQVVEKHFESTSDVRIWMRNNQMGRRNLTPAWRIELALGNKEDLAAVGIEKKSHGQTAPGKTLLSQNDKSVDEPKHNTQAEIATIAGTSTGMVGMAEVVRAKSPEVWEKAKEGEISVSAAYKEIKNQEKKEARKAEIEQQRKELEASPPVQPPENFDVIVIDPPWPYGREYDPEGSRIANPYPEMPLDEIQAIHIPAKNDAVIFLWTTHQFLPFSYELLKNWGFDYKATMVWDKEKIGMGAWLRMQCEFCLVGIKGKPTWENTTYRDILKEPRREHSRKPESFYEMVEKITLGHKIDYFSRQNRLGWYSYGNDTEKF